MPPPNWFERWIKIHGADLTGHSLIMPDTGAFTAVKFNHPAGWESDPFLDSGDTTKFSIPHKLAGRYHLCATIRWHKTDDLAFKIRDREDACFLAYLTKNGDTLAERLQETRISVAPVVKATHTVMYLIWEGTLRKNDFIKLFITYDGTFLGATDIPISAMANVWLTLRRLGPPV
jgi:hypothetical protein